LVFGCYVQLINSALKVNAILATAVYTRPFVVLP
jgi:hypothetical protein